MATREQWQLDAFRVAQRRSTPFRPNEAGQLVTSHCRVVSVWLLLVRQASPDYLLNMRERQQVDILDREYQKRYGTRAELNENLMYYLGDNARWSLSWPAASGAIPCYRTSSGFTYHRQSRRWLVTADKLASLAWPVTPSCAEAMGLGACPLPVLDPARGDVLAGNSMHLANVSVAPLLAYCCFGFIEEAPLWRQV